LRFPLPEGVAGAATWVFRPPAAAPPANAVIAIETAFPARGLTFQGGIARNRAVNAAFYINAWRCRFLIANTGLSTSFSPGDIGRDNMMKSTLFRRIRSFRR
jgi:hypothetical protein